MGFPYSEASWSVVDGAMYMGWGGSMPMLFTLISAALCVGLLVIGNRHEKKMYDKYR